MNGLTQQAQQNNESKSQYKYKYDELYKQYVDIKNKQVRLKQLKENVAKYDNERLQYVEKKNEASRPELKKQALKQLMNHEKEIFKNTKKMENYLILDSIINELERDKIGITRNIKEEENNKAIYEETKKSITKRLNLVCNDLETAYVYIIYLCYIEKSTIITQYESKKIKSKRLSCQKSIFS